MRAVIIISKCMGKSKKEGPYPFFFHFKGVYFGHYITNIQLRSNSEVEVNTEYLIYVKVERIEEEILMGQIIKIRKLEDCWDRS